MKTNIHIQDPKARAIAARALNLARRVYPPVRRTIGNPEWSRFGGLKDGIKVAAIVLEQAGGEA